MKKRRKRIFPAILYVLLLILLLMLQMGSMDGVVSKLVASLLSLILAVPTILLVVKYGTEEEQPHNPDETPRADGEIKEPEKLSELQLFSLADRYGLTRREKEVLKLLWLGYTNLQIAEELYISETTVKKHVTHIFEKLQTSGRKELRKKIWEESLK